MAPSNGLFKVLNSILPFADFLYILQLEEYYSGRYFKRLGRFFFRRNVQKRDHLVITQQVIVIFAATVGLMPLIPLSLTIAFKSVLIPALATLIEVILIPVFIGLANIIVSPLSKSIKAAVQKKASLIFAKQTGNTKVIAIAGSYGKTTTKNLIYQLIRHSFKTQIMPGNINTPTGIAQWLTRNFDTSAEVLIVEMDAYEPGEIAAACMITPPDIAILLNIGDQHMERFITEERQKKALSEIFTHAKKAAICITNAETKAKLSGISRNVLLVEPRKTLYTENEIRQFNPGLSDSVIENLFFALAVAKILKIPQRFIEDTIRSLEIPERRQKVTEIFGYEGIDDSYNISFTTAQAGVKTAKAIAQQKKKRLVVITAGIPELGPKQKDNNRRYGEFLQKNVDHTIILKSILSGEIQKGVAEKALFTVMPNLAAAQKELENSYSQDDWFVLLQPELTDVYY